jgi:uric acid transporter
MALQHVLAMYTGAIAVPFAIGAALDLDRETIGLLVTLDLFVCGVATIIQSVGIGRLIGVRLPIVTGAAFATVTPMITVGQQYGLPAMWGCLMIAGLLGMILAWPFSRLLRFFPPVVSGTSILAVGVALVGVSVSLVVGGDPEAPGYGSPRDLLIATLLILLVVGLSVFFKNFVGRLGVLLAMIIGGIAAIPLGLTSGATLRAADWFKIPTPFHFGAPEFPIGGIIAMTVGTLILFTEATAVILAVGKIVDKPVSNDDIARALRSDGLSGVIGGVFNGFMAGAFTQNVGLVGLTNVRSRWITATAGGIMIALSLIPKMGALVASIPTPVIGGVSAVLFGTIAAVGIRMLGDVDWELKSNGLIFGVSFVVALAPMVAPQMYRNMPMGFQTLFGNALIAAVIVAFVLNAVLNEIWPRIAPSRSRNLDELASSDAAG